MLQLVFHTNGQSPALTFAQSELEDYLRRMLPAEQASLEITLTETPGADDPLLDRYSIHADPQRIEIRAGSGRAVLLGVYRLLFELGCRFSMPGRAHELVPAIRRAELHVELTQAAFFRHRGVCIEGADSLENVLDHIDWLPKIGCNSFFLQHLEPESFLKNWYTHKYNPLSQPQTPSDEQMYNMYREIDQALAVRGLVHHRAGHGWTSQAVGFTHACAHCAQEPDDLTRGLLAEIGGRRAFWNGVPSNTNLCYSEPAACAAFVGTVVDYARSHPEVDHLHVWLADEFNNICECERCRSTTPSDQYIRLLNDIDERLCAEGLDTRIVLLLYQELLWPPVREKLRNPGRFTLMFAPISRTFSRSYAQRGEVPALPPYQRNRIQLPHTLEENLAFLNAWNEQCPLDSFVYDYPMGRAHYGDPGYHHIARIIWQDIRELPALGLNGYISCQELRAAFPNAFPEYVMARMLWDPSLRFEELEQEYYAPLYGPGWAVVRDYLRCISEHSSCDYFNGIGPRHDGVMAQQWADGARYIGEHFPLVRKQFLPGNDLQRKAALLLDYHAKYCTLLMGALAALAAGDTEIADVRWTEFMAFIRRQEPEFQPYLDVYRVLEVATKYTGFALDMPR